MKNIFATTTLIIILLNLTSCKSKNQEPNNDSDGLKRIWMLVDFQDFKREDLVVFEAQMDLKNLNQANAKMRCNIIGLSVKTNKDKINFTNGFRTEMYCENAMKLENEFCKAIVNIETYQLERHKLYLENAKHEKIIFVAQDWD